MSGGAGDYMGNMFFKLQTVDRAGTTDPSNTGWADPSNTGWADSLNTSGANQADGIIEFGDESDLAIKDPDEPIEQGDQNALLKDLIVMGLGGTDNALAIEEFLGKATYGQAIEFLEKLDARDGNFDDILDASDGLET